MLAHNEPLALAILKLMIKRLLFLGFLPISVAWAEVPDIPDAEAVCAEVPEPNRWLNAGEADIGRSEPLISAHRGAIHLAPENTLLAYEYALAYEVALIEVDVRQTADGHFVAFHDSDVSNKTDGSGALEEMTLDQALALNVAANDTWAGTIYDPSRMATLQEILDLAQTYGHGIEFDMKFALDSLPTPDFVAFADLVNQYPETLRRSIINLPPPVSLVLRALVPEGRFIYNLLDNEPPAALFPVTQVASVFGSKLAKFSPEAAAAIHDGCALLMPHAYDEGVENEAAEILRARVIGADGVQTNQPMLARALLVGPVPTMLVATGDGLCLQNADNGLGLPGKPLVDRAGNTRITALRGCVEAAELLPPVSFAGDDSAAPATLSAQASARVIPLRGGGAISGSGLVLLAIACLVSARRRARGRRPPDVC